MGGNSLPRLDMPDDDYSLRGFRDYGTDRFTVCGVEKIRTVENTLACHFQSLIANSKM